MAVTEFTFLVSKTIKHKWTITLKADSFEEAERKAIYHVEHGEMPRDAEGVHTGYDVVPAPNFLTWSPSWMPSSGKD